MEMNLIKYVCPSDITSFNQCNIPKNANHVYCENNKVDTFEGLPEGITNITIQNTSITSFKYLPKSITSIVCGTNNINSFEFIPANVKSIYIVNTNITSFKYLPYGVMWLYCNNNNIKNLNYLPPSVKMLVCSNNPCCAELISKGLRQIHRENNDIIISNWLSGMSNLRYLRLNYLIHSIWKRYWYDQRDDQGYSRACRHLASKNCPDGFLSMFN